MSDNPVQDIMEQHLCCILDGSQRRHEIANFDTYECRVCGTVWNALKDEDGVVEGWVIDHTLTIAAKDEPEVPTVREALVSLLPWIPWKKVARKIVTTACVTYTAVKVAKRVAR